MVKYEDEELAKLTPEERQKKLEKKHKRKQKTLSKEQEMFEAVLQYQNIGWLPKEQEIYLRKMIRKDILQIMKLEKEEAFGKNNDTSSGDDDSDDDDFANHERRLEDKVQYGSDSDMDIDKMVNQRPDYEYYVEYDEEEESEQ